MIETEHDVLNLLHELHRMVQLRDRLSTYEQLLIAETLRTVADQIAPKRSSSLFLLSAKGPRGKPLYHRANHDLAKRPRA